MTFVGSVLPTSFGEMTDKFIIVEGQKTLVWGVEGQYVKVTPEQFLALPALTPEPFIEIHGQVTTSEAMSINASIAKRYTDSPTIIAIKNGTTQYKQSTDEVAEERQTQLSWEHEVEKAMTEDQKELFRGLLQEVYD